MIAPNPGDDATKKLNHSYTAGWMSSVTITLEKNMTVSFKTIFQTYIHFTIWSSYCTIVLLDVYPRKITIDVHPEICSQMFNTALFVIAKAGNNPNILQQVKS